MSICHIKEARSLTNLLKISITERSLDDDIDQVLRNGVIGVFKLSIELNETLGRLLDHNGILVTEEAHVELYILFKLMEHIDALTRDDIETKSLIEG